LPLTSSASAVSGWFFHDTPTLASTFASIPLNTVF
jgi:hypothetical protein